MTSGIVNAINIDNSPKITFLQYQELQSINVL